MTFFRLDKILSSQLQISRKEAGKLIKDGAVCVNGTVILRPENSIDPSSSEITVSGRRITYQKYIYLLLNKPLGYVCSTEDPGCPTVLELVPKELYRDGIFPAGRLDKYTEGMVLLTDDGNFAHRILTPKRHVDKRYYVKLDKPVVNADLTLLFEQGMAIDGGEVCLPSKLEAISPFEAMVTIHQGMYHQIRRMFGQTGANVIKLVRLQIGGLVLDPQLGAGECRPLTESELTLITGENSLS